MKRKIPIFPVLLVLLILLAAAGFGYYTYRIQLVNGNFHRDDQYEEINWNRTKQAFSKLSEYGVDLSMPGVSAPLTFSSPQKFEFFSHFQAYTVKKGDPLTCDFASFSGGAYPEVSRSCILTLHEKGLESHVELNDFSALYYAALKQNGLEDAFEQDFGKPLTKQSARQALRAIDRQLYEKGIMNPVDYPFNKFLFRHILTLAAILGPLCLVLLSVLLSYAVQRQRYSKYLRVYNQENTERWDEIAGTLPEFHSLENSGANMEAKPLIKPPGLLDAVKSLFKTP